MTHELTAQPLDSSIHLWSAATGEISSGLLRFEADPDSAIGARPRQPHRDEWHVTIHWRLVDGHPMPVGIDVRSYREPVAHDSAGHAVFDGSDSHMHRGPRPGEAPKPVTRELFKRLPVGEIVRQGRDQIADWHDALSDHAGAHTPEREWVAEALRAKPENASPSDTKYRRTAEIYAAVADRPNPALLTWRQLDDEGLTTRSGESPSAELVRTKWIPEARRRGYLPPASPRRTTTSATTKKKESEK